MLVGAGLGPEPYDHPDSWSQYLQRHAETLWQCDFASKRKWTISGKIDVYFLVFIHLGSRRIWISPSTENPTGDWTSQQARNFQMHVDDKGLKCERLCRDNDTKYVDQFDAVFKSSGCKVKRITPLSPNLQAHVERVIQTIKHEVLNAFCIVSNRHMDYILRTAMRWYNERRGHSARDNLPPVRISDPTIVTTDTMSKIVCDLELGGHLKSYRRVASQALALILIQQKRFSDSWKCLTIASTGATSLTDSIALGADRIKLWLLLEAESGKLAGPLLEHLVQLVTTQPESLTKDQIATIGFLGEAIGMLDASAEMSCVSKKSLDHSKSMLEQLRSKTATTEFLKSWQIGNVRAVTLTNTLPKVKSIIRPSHFQLIDYQWESTRLSKNLKEL